MLTKKLTILQAFTVVAIISFFVVNALMAARTHTPTVDEFVHLPVGLYHLQTGKYNIDRRAAPLPRTLSALPLFILGEKVDADMKWRGSGERWWPCAFANRFMRTHSQGYFDLYFYGRCVTILISILGGLCLFVWTENLFGLKPAFGSLFLYCTSPTILGHSSLVTADIVVSSFLLMAFFALYKVHEKKTIKWQVIAGLTVGLAVASKFSAIFFLPILPVLLAVGLERWDRKGIAWFAMTLSVICLVALAAINAAYQFPGTVIPNDMLKGIWFKATDKATGELPAYLNGKWELKGFWYYYFVALFYKVPIPFLLLAAIGLLGLLLRKAPKGYGVWLILPPLFLLYLLSFHYQINYGIRLLLPAFPFLIMIAGCGIKMLLEGNVLRKAFLAALLVWQVASSAWSSPHHLAYFNELAKGPDQARKILLDSNIDWGQDLGRLKEYMDEKGLDHISLAYFGHTDPRLYGIQFSLPPISFKPGTYAISANYLGGYPYSITYMGPNFKNIPMGEWSWLDKFIPIDRVGRSIYIFNINLN